MTQTMRAAGPVAEPARGAACAHCGLQCPMDAPEREGRSFCCAGCETVFSLLAEAGLGRFYELAEKPGVRVRASAGRERVACLDEAAVRGRLLDFEDERQARVTFHLPAIHCVACVWLLENLFRLHPGLGRSQVNFGRREVAITFAPEKIKLSELAALLASLGYEPSLNLEELDKDQAARPSPLRRQWLQVGLAGFAFGNIMLMSLPVYFGLDSFTGPWFRAMAGWLSLAIALPVLVFSAADYWRSAWFSLRQRVMTLDVPIALGLAAIYGQSVFEIASRTGEGYCDSLTGLIFFLLLGRLFQQKTHERLSFDRDYKGFFPLAVTRLRSSRREEAQNSLPSEGGRRHQDPGEHTRPRVFRPAPSRVGGTQANSGVSGKPQVFREGAENHTRGRVCSPAFPATDGEESVSIDQLAVGDWLLIRHGELIPADATLVAGAAQLDYSFVTGEADPVTPRAGERLYAGGRQVGGAIEVATVKPVSESYLASLWNSEAFRKPRRDDLDTLTNRYSRQFTALIISVAVGAAAFWLWHDPARAMKAFASVLIVACPCALALAAPLTLGTAQRLLGRRRVHLKSALVIERLAEVDTVVLDKTGTLTGADAGQVRFTPSHAASGDELRFAASLARHSTHPYSARIASIPGTEGVLAVRGFAETPGCGVEGEVSGRAVLLGSTAWLESRGVNCDAAANDGGQVWLAVDGCCRGVFALNNSLRAEVDQLIARLRGRCELALLSGDNAREEACFRALLGPQATLLFNQSPMDKLAFIQSLEERNRRVMMVGDGLNDAGALRQASVGVAVVEQHGAFSPASDVILHAAELPRLAEVLDFARGATRVVRAGFAVSALYNVVGISIAAAGLLSPLVCAVLMPVSSVSVVLFAVGATRWMERRSFDRGSSRREEAHSETTGEVSLLTSAPTGEVRA